MTVVCPFCGVEIGACRDEEGEGGALVMMVRRCSCGNGWNMQPAVAVRGVYDSKGGLCMNKNGKRRNGDGYGNWGI